MPRLPFSKRPLARQTSSTRSRADRNRLFRRSLVSGLETLEGRQLLAADVTLFADSFEAGSNSNDWASNWVEDSQNDYFRSTQRATDGNVSAEVDGRASNATLMLGNPIDLSSYDSAALTFDWLIESGFDSGEYIALDVSSDGGATWTNSVRQLNGNSDPENQWQSESVDLTPYTSSNVLIRFRAQVSLSSEDANIDNVKITGVEAGNQAPAANAGEDQTLNDAGGNGDEFVMLTGSGSDSDGEVVSYEWRQGSTILGTTADITPTLPIGTHELTLTVTDNEGASSADTVVVTVREVDVRPVKVFILAGQSNTTGTASAENLDPAWNVPQDDVWIWLDHNMDGGQWTTVEPGHGWGTHAPRPDEPEGLDARNGLGPELSLARTLADAYPDHRIALIKHGDGGRDLAEHFNPDNVGPPESSEHMWKGLLKKTEDAFAVLNATGQTYEVEGFFWDLGGGDARNRNSGSSDPAEVEAGRQEAMARSEAYGANLTNFIAEVRGQYGEDLPFIMTRITDDIDPDLLDVYPGGELVRQGQLDVAATVPGTVAFTTDDITKRDAVHFDAMGQIEFGNRYAEKYLDLTAPQPTINFADFYDVSDLNLVGHASTTNDNRLRLTDAGLRQGSAWHNSKQAVSTSFETQFDFVLESNAQGLSFVIQNARPEMLGGNPGYQGVPNSLVIDFDTRMQSNQNDPNDNHVSIQSRGREHNSAHHDFSLGTAIVLPDMNDGQSHTAKIRYEGGILSVFVDDMVSPVLSTSVEIDALLDLEFGQAWVGFTSGNNRHEVLNWQFRPLVDLSTTIGIHDAEILEGDDGTQQLVFLVQRSGPATASIQWSTVDDSAVAGDDYAAASGMIEFTDGGHDIQQISVPILSDTSEEAFEDFFVDLSITSGQATVVDDRGTGTILNDDALISIVDASAIEGATGFTFSDEFVAPAIDGLWTMSRGMDFGPDGNLYVTVEQGPYPGAVLRYNGETGEFMGAFATHNELDGAKDIEFGPDGNLYVTNNRTDKILRFDGATGDFIDVYVPAGGDLNVPRAIVFGTDNHLYVANANSDEILRYQGPTGQDPGQLIDVFVSAGEGGMDSPTTLTFGPDGTLYVASGAHATYNNSILRFNGTTGDFIDAFDVSGTSTLALVPTAGMIFGPDLNGDGVGELYASNGDGPAEVLAFDPTSGALLEKVVESGEGGLSDPKGLAFTPDGDLLVVSSATRNILRYSGRDRAAFNVTLSSPVGQTVEVDFATVDGTAISGSDYVSTSGTITFAKGMSSQTVFVAGIDDLTQESDEEFQVLLSNAIGASLGDPQATGTILDDGDVGNQEPTADAGADQTFSDNDGTGSQTVTLSGSGFDPDGSIVAYEWTDGVNVLGTTATISPSLSVGIHTLTLTVTDNEGATGSDTVVVTVDANQAPSADAGADQSAADADGSGEQVVTLIGSGSDPDGSITSYQWNDGATILGNAATISPTLSVGTHTLTFTITDNGGATSSDSVVVTITANQAPTADAGADQSIIDSDDDGSETVTLSGSGSDVDGSIVAYQWTEGATVLGNTASISPSLSVGTHTLTLTVTDNGGATASDSVTVIVEAANTGPNLSHGNIASVSSTWQTVSLGQSYNSAVIVATPRYNSGSGPGVVRISNVTATSFDVRVDNAGLSAFSGGVHFTAMEEGVYDVPGEYKLEAVKVDSSVTSGKSGGWQIGSQGYQQNYSNPVVVGQVMSANDADWSVFWSSSNSRTSPASSASLNIGKHVAEDTDTTRANETLGYFVIESTSGGTINGLSFSAGVGGDTIRGLGNGTFRYGNVTPAGASTAVLSSAGMDGADGGWAALIGNNPLPTNGGSIDLAIDEDQIRDSERNHTTEQVAYFVIGKAVGEGEAARSLATPKITVHNPLDVNGDGFTSPIDALQVINALNTKHESLVAYDEGDNALDTNGDGNISPIDALLVINKLNANNSAPATNSDAASIVDGYFADFEDEEETLFDLDLV